MSRIPKDIIATAYETLRSENPWSHRTSRYLHHRILPHATLAPWLNDESFQKTYESIRKHTLVDIYRCHELWSLAKQSLKVNGAILEVGVWRGGTGAIIAEAARNTGKEIFLADTFSGVVKAGPNDTSYKGGEDSDTSLSIVSDLLRSLDIKNVRLLQGTFPEDTGYAIPGSVSLLHCDVDVYSSAKDIVDWCLPRMQVGAIMVFDDYGFFGCEGISTLCDELRFRDDLMFTHNLNGHAIFIKIK
jgi:O-methyltransferase